ncbi:hypothetical protein PAE9249_00955 [Paenibacillus sp. CECT 9249]|nr:hypothetical protein PAE9249_00955 [Paenibacillus sp. CECT 9249]
MKLDKAKAKTILLNLAIVASLVIALTSGYRLV